MDRSSSVALGLRLRAASSSRQGSKASWEVSDPAAPRAGGVRFSCNLAAAASFPPRVTPTQQFVLVLVAVVLALCVPMVWLWAAHRTRRARLRIVEKLAESGAPPEVVLEQLEREGRSESRGAPRRALVLLAIGLAFLVNAWLQGSTEGLFPGMVLTLIGLALLVANGMERGRGAAEDERSTRP